MFKKESDKMKVILLFIFMAIFITTLFSEEHVPWYHIHYEENDAECYAYAIGRAYGKTKNDACNPLTMSGNGILSNYFYKVNSIEGQINYNDIMAKDVIEFGDHAVFVTQVSSSNPSFIYVDHKKSPDDPDEYSETLMEVIYSYGSPKWLWRQWDRWEITVKNEFTGGDVKVKNTIRNSPWLEDDLEWGSSVNIVAIEDNKLVGGLKRDFKEWNKNNYPIQGSTKSYNAGITDNYTLNVTWEAQFDNYYHFTFQNSFVGLSENGNMKVNGTTYNNITLQDTFWIEEHTSISFQALSHSYNNINYSFDHWNDQGTLSTRTINDVSNHGSYTAYFKGKPTKVSGFEFDCDIGNPIHFTWNQHPNSNVKYKIYRKRKNQYGSQSDPVLIATLNNNQTSYTDYDYEKAQTYIWLLFYDVRAYYTTEATEADQEWYALYGQAIPKIVREQFVNQNTGLPTEFKLINYPNPFNPETNFVYSVPEMTYIKMKIYNSNGQFIKTLFEGARSAGVYVSKWSGVNDSGQQIASGVYYLIMELPDRIISRKLLLLR